MKDETTKVDAESRNDGSSEACASDSASKLGTGGAASAPREIHRAPTTFMDETASAGPRMDIAGDAITAQHEA